MARQALVIHREKPGPGEERLGRILTFFGVPWRTLSLTDLSDSARWTKGQISYAVLGSAETLGKALTLPYSAAVLKGAAAIYVYATNNREVSTRTLSTLAGSEWRWTSPSVRTVSVDITGHCPELTGPMSGLRVDTQLAEEDGVVAPSEEAFAPNANGFVPIVSVNGDSGFVRIAYCGVPTYFCASAAIVDIEAPVHHNYYDVKDQFLSAVPLVMFITWAFRDVMWRPAELGACLIIDDPLLKERYGFCDFGQLRKLMVRHGFTTNIAFIPWNWRRTSRGGSDFFRRERAHFSVSVHGCDHIAAEFGTTAVDALDSKAKLAQLRMRKHFARTRIQHDPVMVFPQGVFSSRCPEVLKLNGFVAAVNTEVVPLDRGGTATRVRDVWDVAIMSYGSFPIYTRRYAFHGIENFAFDLLLGKPCFIVAHHDFFNDDGAAMLDLISRLSALNGDLSWRSPLEVVRRAYRRRTIDVEEIEMYATELMIPASTVKSQKIVIRKREDDAASVASVQYDGNAIEWRSENGFLQYFAHRPGQGECLLSVRYTESPAYSSKGRSIRYEITVAIRRLLSEFRDEYAHKIGFKKAS